MLLRLIRFFASFRMTVNTYYSLISAENIFQAWEEFKKGKRQKYDVQVFERNLEDNIFDLYERLENKTYRHGGYKEFWVNDPKRRHIHKASVEDRIVHHLLYKYLYEVFGKTFIYDSYSCRNGKGTHKVVKRLETISRKLSRNYTQDFWALKLDIKQFFASVDHNILKELIKRKVKEPDIIWLIENVIDSFCPCHSGKRSDSRINQGGFWTSQNDGNCKGIPLGNLTSQIFANIYLNELDQFVKHQLKVKHYLRYADDFLILNPEDRHINLIRRFLEQNLKLKLHPNKISLRKFSWGIDFCGYVVLPHYVLPRSKTRRRINKRLLRRYAPRNDGDISYQSLQSYLGYLSHAATYNLKNQLVNDYHLTNEA